MGFTETQLKKRWGEGRKEIFMFLCSDIFTRSTRSTQSRRSVFRCSPCEKISALRAILHGQATRTFIRTVWAMVRQTTKSYTLFSFLFSLSPYALCPYALCPMPFLHKPGKNKMKSDHLLNRKGTACEPSLWRR
jgi:hypothetical protein